MPLVAETFDSTKHYLTDLLREISSGKVQLPDFQRGWIWDDDHIKSLLASVSMSYPIGTVMLLQTGGEHIKFRPRLVEGVYSGSTQEPERLILDGQQRLTALFSSLYSGQVVDTRDARKKPIKRWYYIDMQMALAPFQDREEAIISVPEDRILRNFRGEPIDGRDFSSSEKEYEAGLFPLARIFNYADWRSEHNAYWNYSKEKVKLFDEFEREIIKRFERYQIPVIIMFKETPKDAVCQVFEKVNTGGVTLTVFELLTATFAATDFSLRDDWAARFARLTQHPILENIQSTDFLQSITLLVTYQGRLKHLSTGASSENAPGVSCKRRDILKLSVDDYKEWAGRVEQGYDRIARFLRRQRILTARDLPYQTQLIPLASIMTLLGNEAEKDGVQTKLAYWYWCGVLGELYGSAVESRFARDLPDVVEWILNKGSLPKSIEDANFVRERLYTLRTRNSAAYKGIHALLMRDGCMDFRTGQPIQDQMYFEDAYDVHHIFPREWCDNHRIDKGIRDCVVNKTPISARTNRMIGGRPPSEYLEVIQKSAEISSRRMDEILRTHLVEPSLIRSDNFDEFFEQREHALLSRIEQAMNKAVVRNIPEDLVIDEDYEGVVEAAR